MDDTDFEAAGFMLRNDHPLMAVFATKLERVPVDEGRGGAELRVTFDGPGLPEKLCFAEHFPPSNAAVSGHVAVFFKRCEFMVAKALRR